VRRERAWHLSAVASFLRPPSFGYNGQVLRLSKKTDYALIAMKHLALNGDRGASSAREIAEQYDIPAELMAKVLQRLVRRQLLVSHQGTRGGYQLARPSVMISVADVIQAVDGPLTVTACSTDDHACEQFTKCNVRDPLWRIKDRVLTALASCTLAEIVDESSAPTMPVSLSRRTDGKPASPAAEPVKP